MRQRKERGIRHKTIRFCPTAIKAKVVDRPHRGAPHARSKFLLSTAPLLKYSECQIWEVVAGIAQKSIQRMEHSTFDRIIAPQRSLQCNGSGSFPLMLSRDFPSGFSD